MVPRMPDQPFLDEWCFVRRGVVQYEVNVEIVGNTLVDCGEELAELLGSVTTTDLTQNGSGLDVESREEIRRATPLVVMRSSLWSAWAHRQKRLRTVQSLNLCLLIHTQHQCVVWRVKVEAHDVAHLLDKQRVGGKLERLAPVRLQPESSPDAADRTLAKPGTLGQRPRAPMRGGRRRGLQGQGQDPLDIGIRNGAGCTWTRFVEQAGKPIPDKTLPPLADGLLGNPEFCRHLVVREILRTSKHDPRAQRQCLGRLPSPRPLAENRLFFRVQHQSRLRSAGAHRQFSLSFKGERLRWHTYSTNL